MKRRPWASHLLVFLQIVFVVLCCYPVDMRNWGHPLFLILCLFGAVLGLVVLSYNRPSNFSIYPEVRDGAVLITNGPYRIVRHPMYTALMLMMIGIAGYNGRWINTLAAAGLIVVIILKVLREERSLVAQFTGYNQYATPLKRFVPGLF